MCNEVEESGELHRRSVIGERWQNGGDQRHVSLVFDHAFSFNKLKKFYMCAQKL